MRNTPHQMKIQTTVPSLLGIPEYRDKFLSSRCNEEDEKANRWLRPCMQGRTYWNVNISDVIGAADDIIHQSKTPK